MKDEKLEWVIFDAWGVIYTKRNFIHSILYPFLKKLNPKIQEEVLYKEYFKASRGKLTSRNFWKNIGYEEQYPEIEEGYLESISCLDKNFIEFIPKIKKEFRVAILTNDVKEWSRHLLNKFKIIDYFEEIIISGEVGFRKPGVEIFKNFLEKTNAKPTNCLFVDDRLTNLKAATEVGINVIRFIRKEKKTPYCSEFEVGSFNELFHTLNNFYR